MLDWLRENGQGVSAIASVLMLVIWILYFQLLLNQYRHRLRPKILINRDGGDTLDARCIVANMSAEPIYVEAILVQLGSERGRTGKSRGSGLDGGQYSDPLDTLRQGPMESGQLIDAGSYRDLLNHALEVRSRRDGGSGPSAVAMKVIVIATYTAEDSIVAAERSFDISPDGFLLPHSYTARQIRRRGERRRLERFVLDFYGLGIERRRAGREDHA